MRLTENDVKWYGTEYGGFFVVPKLIKNSSNALCVGLGEDVSFDIQLIGLHNIKVLGVDPTKKAKDYISRLSPNNYDFINSALVSESYEEKTVKMFENKNPDWVSESLVISHNAVSNKFYEADVVKLSSLLEGHNFDIVKMDIEGAEYDILDQFNDFKCNHLCIEFHHHCTDYSESDTERCLRRLHDSGFKNILTKNYKEVTLIRE